MKLLVYVYLNFIINEVLRLFGATRDVIFIQSKQFFCSPFFRHRNFRRMGISSTEKDILEHPIAV